MASFPFRLPGRNASSSSTRYAPLSTTNSASASHTAAPHFYPFRPRSLSSSLRRCLAVSSSPCFYALFFLSVVAILLFSPLSYLPASIPPLNQGLSTFAGGCQPEDFVKVGRAVWVADPAFARRFGCDPSVCHCLFVEGGSGVGGESSRRLSSSFSSSSSPFPFSTSFSFAVESENKTTRSVEMRAEGETRIRSSSSERTRRRAGEEQGGGYIRHVFLSASIKRVHYFHEDKPLCLVPHRRYDDLVQVHGLDRSQTVHATWGPSVWYSNDLVNPYHMIHFRVLPIFAWMVRQGLEAGEHITFFEPKPKDQLPGGYGTYLMRRLGTMMWAEDFGPHSSILFDDLWIRPRGRWLYPVHSFFPEVHDLTKQLVTYGTHVDARWNQMSAFFRRQLLSSHEPPSLRHREMQQLLAEPSQQPYILLVDRASTRCLLDSNTSSFEEIMRVLREEGGLGNVETVRMEDISEEEQFQKVMHASVLIGVHGAALTNMVWQPPVLSTVIEIGFNPRKPDYSNLARVLGRAYRYLAADRVEEKVGPNPIAWKKVYIDSHKLLGVIKEVLAERMERQGWLCC